MSEDPPPFPSPIDNASDYVSEPLVNVYTTLGDESITTERR